jgi:hypothetical protein
MTSSNTHNTDEEYNGHKSIGHWNVSLWLGNDEALYDYARNSIETLGSVECAAAHMAETLHGKHTPDGYPYTLDTIKEALESIA